MRISKYCGDEAGDCFAPNYYQYADRTRKVYNFNPTGSCALLKNGMSICITPQIAESAINGYIDLNGLKGPNVLDRDLRTFSISLKTRTSMDTTQRKISNHCLENPTAPECQCEGDDCIQQECLNPPSSPTSQCCELPKWSETEYCDQCPTAPTSIDDPCCADPRYAGQGACYDPCPTMPTSKTDAYGQACCSDSRWVNSQYCKEEASGSSSCPAPGALFHVTFNCFNAKNDCSYVGSYGSDWTQVCCSTTVTNVSPYNDYCSMSKLNGKVTISVKEFGGTACKLGATCPFQLSELSSTLVQNGFSLYARLLAGFDNRRSVSSVKPNYYQNGYTANFMIPLNCTWYDQLGCGQ